VSGQRIGTRQRQPGNGRASLVLAHLAGPYDATILSGRVAARHLEIAAGCETSVSDTCRQDADVAYVNLHIEPALPAQSQPRPAGDTGEHLMAARVEMLECIDAVDPIAAPAIA